ncbi:MAG: hypothetical protein WAK52_04480 [Trichococcus sp.]
MTENQNKLMELVANEVEKNNGFVFLATLKDSGYPNQSSLNYLKKEGFEKISGGIYLSPLYYEDDMYVFQKRFAKGVYSHETALYLHNLSDVTPFNYTMTFPRGYHSKKIKEEPISVVWKDRSVWQEDQTTVRSSNGNDIVVYSMERTLCDMFNTRYEADEDVRLQAIVKYMKRADKNIPKLLNLAKRYNVLDKLKTYVEVLL